MIQILAASTTSVNVSAVLVVDQITYTAIPVGTLGNAISIAYVKNGTPNQGTSASVMGSHSIGWNITVWLEVNSSDVITATATQVAAAIADNTISATLVTTTVSGGGTNVQAATAATLLASGVTGVYQRQGNTLVGLQFLNGFTGTTITFKGSSDGVHFGTVYDSAGSAVSLTIPSYVQYMIVSFSQAIFDAVGKLPFLQLVTGSSQDGNVLIAPIAVVI